MQKNEIRKWNKNARLFERVEMLIEQRAPSQKLPIIFFEGLLTYLADGFLGCQLSMQMAVWTSDSKDGLE